MNTKEQILTDLYLAPNTNKIIDCVAKGHRLTDELKSELYLILCEMSEDKIVKAFEGKYLNYLVVNILRKQFLSSTSPFFNKFRANQTFELREDIYNNKDSEVAIDFIIDNSDSIFKYSDESEEHEKVEYILSKVDTLLEDIEFLDREIFQLYFKMGKYDIHTGSLRDRECSKPTSSYRKIAAKLSIGVNKHGNPVTITPKYSNRSVNKTLDKIKKHFDNDEL